ncbi:unnamed protein product [Acanthocheilonema viteae]|uniref:EndoU domain-containing protein n=1 Tax=Acanthocheilonema viteae TaxID=6277 RepID=A0A498SCW6_ACAVI|nr:unnamed protein product [Acanthocheilonema viteae]
MVNNAEIVNLVNQFRQQDINKADNKQIILDYQNRTTVNDPSDKAQRRFFKHVDPALLKKNMYRKWIALSNEFVPEVGIEEKDTPKNFMAAVKFSWRNHTKQAASFFIGTSPEFDLALYTLCFLTRQLNRTCQFEIDGCTFFITSYNFKQRGKNFIGTIYPVAGQFTNKCRHHNIQ